MSQRVAFAAPGLSIVAGDTRFTEPDGRVVDIGESIRRVPGGWVGGTGAVPVVLYGLRQLEKVGVTDLPAARRAVRLTNVSVRAAAGEANVSESCFLITREHADGHFSIHAVRDDGTGPDLDNTSSGGFSQLISWAPGMSDADKRSGDSLMKARVSKSESLPQIIRAIAFAFDWGYRHGRDVSAEVEAGLSIVSDGRLLLAHLRRTATWLLEASDSEIMASLGRVPTIPPFPGSIAERRYFTRKEAVAA